MHGTVALPPLLVAVMDTPHFQRLDQIQQLGGCHRVHTATVDTGSTPLTGGDSNERAKSNEETTGYNKLKISLSGYSRGWDNDHERGGTPDVLFWHA